MFVRALIVLLVALNLGVAAWWALRTEPAPAPPATQPPGIPRLQLLREKPSQPVTEQAAVIAANPEAAVTSPGPATQCFSLGPFADDTALRATMTRLQARVVRLRPRTSTATAVRGYNVVLPPFASRELAQAASARLVAAGFDDLLVINDGPETNGIALGRYGSQQAASRHQAALQAAGFPAQLRPIGGGAEAQWLDLEVREGFDVATARIGSGVTRQQTIDCASLG